MIKKFSAFNKYVLTAAAASLIILYIILFTLPDGYTSFASKNFLSDFFIFVTLSCNPIAIVVSVFVITFILFFSTRKFLRLHHSIFVFALISIGIISMGYYLINYLKGTFPAARPYYDFLYENKILPEELDEFIKLSPVERKNLYKEDSVFAKVPPGVNPRVYKLWISETALSFPSGHAFNSVFLGILYSCILFFSLEKRYRLLYLAPLVWMIFVCLSRIILGLHHKIDVVFGSLLGLLAALVFIYAGALNKIIFLDRDANSKTP